MEAVIDFGEEENLEEGLVEKGQHLTRQPVWQMKPGDTLGS